MWNIGPTSQLEETLNILPRSRVEPDSRSPSTDILLGMVVWLPTDLSEECDADPELYDVCTTYLARKLLKDSFHDPTTITIPTYRKSVHLLDGGSGQSVRIKMMKFPRTSFMAWSQDPTRLLQRDLVWFIDAHKKSRWIYCLWLWRLRKLRFRLGALIHQYKSAK